MSRGQELLREVNRRTDAVLLDRGLERVVDTYQDAVLAVGLLRRITARHSGAASGREA